MRLRSWNSPVGPRILKTALAVTLALAVIEHYGASPAKVVFATIGAMSAVGPTFTASLLACLTQIFGVAVGGLLALTVIALRIPPVIGIGVGIVGILTGYQYFRFKLVPVLPCLVLVNVCLNPAVEGASYAVGRLWDTAIGLAVGLAVNLLIFPYDNSKKIRQTMEGLDRDLILFLEDLFDGASICRRQKFWHARWTPWRASCCCFPSSGCCCIERGRNGNSNVCEVVRTSHRSWWWSWRPCGTWSAEGV